MDSEAARIIMKFNSFACLYAFINLYLFTRAKMEREFHNSFCNEQSK